MVLRQNSFLTNDLIKSTIGSDMKNCDDCGCRTYGQICSNCHEELYIIEYQGEFVEVLSDEFIEKADRQRRQIEAKHEEENIF